MEATPSVRMKASNWTSIALKAARDGFERHRIAGVFFLVAQYIPKWSFDVTSKLKTIMLIFFGKVNNPKRKMTIKHLNPCYPLDRSPGATIAFTTSL